MNTRRGFGRSDDDPGRRARSEDERRRWERSSEYSDRPYGYWQSEATESDRGPYWEERYSGRPRDRESMEFGSYEPRYTREAYGRSSDPTSGYRSDRGSGYRGEMSDWRRGETDSRPEWRRSEYDFRREDDWRQREQRGQQDDWRRQDDGSLRSFQSTPRLRALAGEGYWQDPTTSYSPTYSYGYSYERASTYPYERSTFAGSGDSESYGRYAGVGPRSYKRADDRIQDEICDRLTRHPAIDASEIEVVVQECEVDLRGSVPDRHQKRLAEDVVESVTGVKDVNNHLKVEKHRPIGDVSSVGMSRNVVGGIVSTQIHPEMEVFSSDDQSLGKVKEVRPQHFLLDRPMARDLYVPLSSVLDVRANRAILSVMADRLDQMGWAKTGEEAEIGIGRKH